MFQWGILSTAKIAREQVVPAIFNSSNGNLRAIASRDKSKAESFAQDFAIPKAYGSYEELLADPKIDGVYIPLHTSGHVEWSKRAAEARKHVLCEKPIALQAAQIDDLIETAKANGVIISEAFMVTYHPQWHKLRELLSQAAIGDLKHIQGVFTYFLDDPNNMRNQPDLGGGALLDIGVYPTITTRFATGKEPHRLRAEITRHDQFGTDIYANVEAEFEGFTLDFYVSSLMALRQNMVFHGTKGVIEVTAPFNPVSYGPAIVNLINQNRSQNTQFNYGAINQYQLQCESFVRATRGEGEVLSLENSKQNQKVIDACFASEQSGGWVDIA